MKLNAKTFACTGIGIVVLAVGLGLFLRMTAARHFVVTVTPVLPDTLLSVLSQEKVPVRNGRLELTGLSPGDHTMIVRAPDYETYTTQVTVDAHGAGTATVQLQPVFGAALIVAQVETIVTAIDANGRSWTGDLKSEKTAGEGRNKKSYSKNCLPLPHGRYTFRFTHPVCAPVEVQGEVVDANLVISIKQEYINSLGMKLVPQMYPSTEGESLLVSSWETREQDYAAFVQAKNHPWKSAQAGANHPATNVSWNDAQAFCTWLTQTERAAGKIGATHVYRLPTDHEWSDMVGLSEDASETPDQKHQKNKTSSPWQMVGPPPPGMKYGNYADKAAQDKGVKDILITRSGFYEDGYAGTSPVGTFSLEKHGVFDLSGNVWEWVEDTLSPRSPLRVGRGGSFLSYNFEQLRWSARTAAKPDSHHADGGFRVVLALK